MTVPDFLQTDDGGFIHLAGHRIGLHHVVRLYLAGASAEMIAAHYPSLPLALVHKVLGFYLENQAEVDRYMAEHDREIERQVGQAKPGPSVAALRERLERTAASKAG